MIMANLQQAGICVSHQEFVLTFSPSKGAYKSSQHVQFICLVCLVLESALVFPVCKLLSTYPLAFLLVYTMMILAILKS